MSLQVWLPLAGNLDNFGLSNVTVTNNGATVDNNGKIGKCCSFGSAKRITVSQPANLSTTAASLSCWVNLSAWGSSYDSLVNLSTGTGWVDTRLAFVRSNTANRIGFCIANGSIYNMTVMTSDLPLNTWTHLTGTFDGSTIKIYVNGVLNNSTTTTFNAIVYSGANLNIGSWSNANNYPINGKLNDVRIYDHCLSAKEVKEISKALVLHYPMNNPYIEETTNINTGSWAAYTNYWTIASQSATEIKLVKNTSTSSSTVALSNSAVLNAIPINTTITVSGYLYKGNAPFKCTQTYLTPYDSPTIISTEFKNNGYFRFTLRLGDKTSGWIIHTPLFGKCNDGDICYIRNMQWEIKDHATGYTLGSRSGMKEIDCGIANVYDGTISGKIAVVKDTPRYSNSYQLTTGSDYIKSNFSATMNELSISFWVKPSSSNGGYSIICSNYNNPSGGLWLATNCEGCGVWAYRGAYMKVSGSLANDTWHHCVYTFKDGVSKWYINGEEKTITTNTYTGTTLPITNLTIGNSYTGTSWNTKRYGNLSDFRLYATALSADDIKELYDTAATIDNNGNMYAYEFVEEA